MDYDTTIPRDDLERMLEIVTPSWRLETATPTAAGHHAVYHLTAATDAGRRECYLKATPPGKDQTVGMEGRLLALLEHHSRIPVPTVIGVVDEREELPTPSLLLAAVDGSVRPRTELPTVSDATLEALARDSGRYLAALHAVDAVDAFGFLTQSGDALDGDRPSGDRATVAVADPLTDWRERLRDWAAGRFRRSNRAGSTTWCRRLARSSNPGSKRSKAPSARHWPASTRPSRTSSSARTPWRR